MKDWEQFLRQLGRDPQEPFNSRVYHRLKYEGLDEPIHNIFKRILPSTIAYSREEREWRKSQPHISKEPRSISRWVDMLARFILACISGASLIGPMLIMSLGPSKNKSLITVSVAVFLFCLILSLVLRLKNPDFLVATGAYTAVLVVFVGASLS